MKLSRTFSLNEETNKMLDELMKFSNSNASRIIRVLITDAYEKHYVIKEKIFEGGLDDNI